MLIKSLCKPQPDKLYGRPRIYALRPRQQRLLDEALPRFRLTADQATAPHGAFNAAPTSNIFLEIGFGGGEHALAQSAAHPDCLYIASEVFENGLCSLLSRLVPEGQEANAPPPDHLRLWPEDARLLLRALTEACLDRIYLMFPDPWPKARHAKRRFVHPDNIALLARTMRPGAEWRIASDHPVYQAWVQEVMASQKAFKCVAYAEGERPDGWSATRYESKALREGRVPFYWTYQRCETT